VPTEPIDYEEAAALYRVCRRSGTTVRKLIDCLIASVAIRADSPILHADADFEVLARHTALRIERP
jgi:predicted nucleic acid-binding protein